MTKKEKLMLAFGAVFVAAFVVLVVRLNIQQTELADKYSQSLELISQGNYTEARLILEEIEEDNFKDTKDFITFCRMAERKEGGSISFNWSDYYDIDFLHCSETQRYEMLGELAELKDWYDEQDAERRKQDKLDEARRISSGPPYVGMSEDYIAKTSLGSPSPNTRHNYEAIGGQQYRATVYDFVKNGRVVFTARCVRGVVTEVWDKSDDEPYVPSYTPSDNKDPYNTSDYSNEEDFYDDHYYDFHDYYQAEAYWREHRYD